MCLSIGNWIALLQKLVRSGQSTSRRLDDADLPWLEVASSDSKTPSPIHNTAGQSTSGSASSPFFYQLPPEIRRQILIRAFGKNRLHIDLRPRYASSPDRRNTVISEWSWCRWSCCRPVFDIRQFPLHPPECFENREDCAEWNFMDPIPPLGAMGWILSCRQAHAEGIDILYGANFINFSSLPLLYHLPKLVDASFLSNVRHLEMLWVLGGGQRMGNVAKLPGSKAEIFNDLISMTTTTFHHLDTIVLALLNYPMKLVQEVTEEQTVVIEQQMMQPLERMLVDLGGPKCSIAVPRRIWKHLRATEECQRQREEAGQDLQRSGRGWWRQKVVPREGGDKTVRYSINLMTNHWMFRTVCCTMGAGLPEDFDDI